MCGEEEFCVSKFALIVVSNCLFMLSSSICSFDSHLHPRYYTAVFSHFLKENICLVAKLQSLGKQSDGKDGCNEEMLNNTLTS